MMEDFTLGIICYSYCVCFYFFPSSPAVLDPLAGDDDDDEDDLFASKPKVRAAEDSKPEVTCFCLPDLEKKSVRKP